MLAAPWIASLVKVPGPAVLSTVIDMAVAGVVCLCATLVLGHFIGVPEVASLRRRFLGVSK
jgi:hypothetical protein